MMIDLRIDPLVYIWCMSDLSITTIQTDLSWEDPAANLSMLEHKIRGINTHTEVVILPEMFSTGFSMRPEVFAEEMDGPSVLWMKRLAREKNIILTGSLMIREVGTGSNEGAAYFNRLIWMLPNGQYGYYDKRHCFGLAGEDRHYRSGNKRLIASVKGWRVNLLICYDLRFPIWSRQTPQQNNGGAVQPEFDLMVFVANWPERRVHAWRTLLQARAIENQCYVAGVNRVGKDGGEIYHSGDSLVAGPLGEILYHREHDEDVHTLTLSRKLLDETREKLPFWKDADRFTIL
jgi:predicted amidohydrolase